MRWSKISSLGYRVAKHRKTRKNYCYERTIILFELPLIRTPEMGPPLYNQDTSAGPKGAWPDIRDQVHRVIANGVLSSCPIRISY